jgi:hypothetical protein
MKTWKEKKKQLTGRSPLRRRKSALDCSAIKEEEQQQEQEEVDCSAIKEEEED